ncbi:MAG: acetylxylan esterase [Armatimonadota bacterium]
MRSITRLSTCLALGGCLGAAQAMVPITLTQLVDGRWQTTGLPYTALISAQGYLESLKVGAFEFLAPSKNAAHGLFLADGDKPIPFTSVRRNGGNPSDVNDLGLVLENEQATVTLRFRNEGIAVTVENRAIPDGHCLRMELNKAVARIKNPATGVEHALPVKLISDAMRLIAPTGASLTLPGQYLYPDPAGNGLYVKGPYQQAGLPEKEFLLELAPAPRLEDLLKVAGKAASDDFTYWAGGAQPFTTEVTNMNPEGAFRGSLVLSLRSYLTKAVVKELRQPLTLAKGATKTLAWTLEGLEPMLYLVEIRVERGKAQGTCGTLRLVYHAAGLLPPAPPKDFDAFWQQTLEAQATIPIDLQIAKVKEVGKSDVYKFNFAGLLGYRCYGWLTVPQDKSKRYPGVLILPSSGLHAIQIPTAPKDDRVAMAINISGLDVDLPPDQYDWRTWPAPYLVTGILQKEYYSMRFCYAALVRAAELLASRPEVQPDNIICYGSSQGGGLTLVAAGLYPRFKAAVANCPALCRLDWNFNILHPEYFPIGATEGTRPMINRTLPYFDASHFARRITCPVWVSVGLMDDVTPAVNVFCAYNVIPAEHKHFLAQPLVGHAGGFDMNTPKGVWP